VYDEGRDVRSVLRTVGLTIGVLAMAAGAYAQARTIRVPGPFGSMHVAAVLLPSSYDSSQSRYPVVYLFPGGGQDHTAYMARTAFPPMARGHEFIVVMAGPERTYGAGSADAQQRYHDFVARDLVAYVDANYRTIPDRASRAIAGLSMGGRIATMVGLTHADRFGVVGAWSAALRGDVDAAVQGAADPAPYFYVSCGTTDSLLAASREFVERLKARGVAHEYREVPGRGHEWAFWDPQVSVFFDLLKSRGFRAVAP
jgi:S-formylglutathione hydrolase FrmB